MTQVVRKRPSELKPRRNIRSHLGSEETRRQLGESLRVRQDTPLLIFPDNSMLDGYRRQDAALLVGLEWLDCIVVEDIEAVELTTRQLVSVMQREDISAYDKAVAASEIKAANVGMTTKQLAEEVLHLHPSTVGRYLGLFECIPEVIEAAKNGLIGLSDWDFIRTQPDQHCALQSRLPKPPATLPTACKSATGNPTDSGSLKRLKLPVAAGVTVTMQAESLSWEDIEQILSDLTKQVKKAKTEGISTKTFQRSLRDMAGTS